MAATAKVPATNFDIAFSLRQTACSINAPAASFRLPQARYSVKSGRERISLVPPRRLFLQYNTLLAFP
jgi:hypothetical protein